MTATELQAAQTYTWTTSGIAYSTHPELASGEAVSRRGASFVVTDQLRQSNLDREGRCWLDVLADESAQIEKWGQVVAVAGAVTLSPWTEGSEEHRRARDDALAQARLIPTEVERYAALHKIREEFGDIENPSNQRSSWVFSDVERDAYLRAEGLRE